MIDRDYAFCLNHEPNRASMEYVPCPVCLAYSNAESALRNKQLYQQSYIALRRLVECHHSANGRAHTIELLNTTAPCDCLIEAETILGSKEKA